jgi:hypothetical protein
MSEQLSEQEIAALKELAQNLMAMGRARRLVTSALLWLAGIVAASFLIWDRILSQLKWGS